MRPAANVRDARVADASTISSTRTLSTTSRQSADTTWIATGHERPVFLDERGWRRRWVLAAGVLASTAAAFWFAALIAGAIGFSTLPSMRSPIPLFERALTHHVVLDRDHPHVIFARGRRHQSLPARATGLPLGRRLISTES